jgi:hypothetical protein
VCRRAGAERWLPPEPKSLTQSTGWPIAGTRARDSGLRRRVWDREALLAGAAIAFSASAAVSLRGWPQVGAQGTPVAVIARQVRPPSSQMQVRQFIALASPRLPRLPIRRRPGPERRSTGSPPDARERRFWRRRRSDLTGRTASFNSTTSTAPGGSTPPPTACTSCGRPTLGTALGAATQAATTTLGTTVAGTGSQLGSVVSGLTGAVASKLGAVSPGLAHVVGSTGQALNGPIGSATGALGGPSRVSARGSAASCLTASGRRGLAAVGRLAAVWRERRLLGGTAAAPLQDRPQPLGLPG